MKKEKKPLKVKRITLILIIVIVLFLGGNAFAALVGAPNIFFAIRNLVVQEEVNNKDELLSDKEIVISYSPIEITDDISLQVNKLVIEENKSTLFIKTTNDGEETKLGFRVETDENGDDAATLGQAKYDIEKGSNDKTIELTEGKVKENDSIVMVIYDEEKELRKLTIDLANKEITVDGKDDAEISKISESELKQYLGCFAILNCDNFNEYDLNDKLIYIAEEMDREIFKDDMKNKSQRELIMGIVDSFYNKEYKKEVINGNDILKPAKVQYDYDEEYDTYRSLTEGSELPKGMCLEVSDISYKKGVYTVEFVYILPKFIEIDQDKLEESQQYKATIKLELNEDSEYSKYKIIELSKGERLTLEKVSFDKEETNTKYDINGLYSIKVDENRGGEDYKFDNGKVTLITNTKKSGTYEIEGNKIKITYTEEDYSEVEDNGGVKKIDESEELEIVDNNTLKSVKTDTMYVKEGKTSVSENTGVGKTVLQAEDEFYSLEEVAKK